MFWQFSSYEKENSDNSAQSCLLLIADYYGKNHDLVRLLPKNVQKEPISQLCDNAEEMGFQAMAIKVPFEADGDRACLLEASLPTIAQLSNNHFVVVNKVNKKYVWINDPNLGKKKLPREEFEAEWLGKAQQGIIVILEPTTAFFKSDNDEKNYQPTQWRYLIHYLLPYKWVVAQLVLVIMLGIGFQLLFPFLTEKLVDFGIKNRNIGFIYMILLAQLTLFLSQMITQFVQSRITLYVGTRVNVSLLSDFLTKLMRLPIGFFDGKTTGDLLQRVGDQTRIEAFLTGSTLVFLFSFINFGLFCALILWYNFMIGRIFVLSAILYIIWILLFLKKRKEVDYARFRQAGENRNVMIELIQGMQEIKLQGSERKRRWIWAKFQAKLFQIGLKSLTVGQWQDTGAAFISQSKDIIITFVAARAVMEGDKSLGVLLATQYMLGQLNVSLFQLATFVRLMQDAKISLERLGDIQQLPTEETSIQKNTIDESNIFELIGNIKLQNCSFRYENGNDFVLKDINLIIPQGKVTAIVGTSGSGKTTLMKLLLSFYQPTEGNILIGEKKLSQFRPAFWREKCGVVMQDGFIFSDTIANNIAESDDRIDENKLKNAIQVANIQEFIEKMPLKENTMVGSRGSGLSQGQRQRLMIARAIYKNPDFLFLDEATNALDTNNERTIVENLQRFYQNRTVVVVAHRLSTVKNADQIVVLDNGRIVEKGTHNELVLRKGAYYNLVKNQLDY